MVQTDLLALPSGELSVSKNLFFRINDEIPTWLPLTRELSAKLTEGENDFISVRSFANFSVKLIVLCINCSAQHLSVFSLPPSKTSFLPPPSSEGGKKKELF